MFSFRGKDTPFLCVLQIKKVKSITDFTFPALLLHNRRSTGDSFTNLKPIV